MTETSAKPAIQDGLAFERPLNDVQSVQVGIFTSRIGVTLFY